MYNNMIEFFKHIARYLILKRRGVDIDIRSTLCHRVSLPTQFKSAKIVNSKLEISKLGDGCFLENVVSYGDIELADNVSISGPGTVLHAVKGKIKIGRFSSIAQNVSIQEFNHKMLTPTTYAINHFFFTHNFMDDVTSKGDVILAEDVWVGSNVVILSGVKIGRGAIIAAGSVVTKDVAPYSIVGGVPAKVIKMRFSDEVIKKIENSRWWEWNTKSILENKEFFTREFE